MLWFSLKILLPFFNVSLGLPKNFPIFISEVCVVFEVKSGDSDKLAHSILL